MLAQIVLTAGAGRKLILRRDFMCILVMQIASIASASCIHRISTMTSPRYGLFLVSKVQCTYSSDRGFPASTPHYSRYMLQHIDYKCQHRYGFMRVEADVISRVHPIQNLLPSHSILDCHHRSTTCTSRSPTCQAVSPTKSPSLRVLPLE